MNIKITLILAIAPVLSGCATSMVHERHGTLHQTKWDDVVNYDESSSGDYTICVSGNLAHLGRGYYQVEISKREIKTTYDDQKIVYPYKMDFTKLTFPPKSVKDESALSQHAPFIKGLGEENCIVLPNWDNGRDVIVECPNSTTYDTKGKILLPLAVVSDVVTFPIQCVLVGFSFMEQ